MQGMTKKELAQVCGYTYRRLHDIDMELPKEKKLFVSVDGGNKYDLPTFVQRWVAYNMDREAPADMDLEEAKALHEQIKIQKTQLEVARMKGELVAVDDVRRLWADIANTVVQNMLRLPNKIAQQVYMVDNMEIVIGCIDKEIRDTLIAVAETPMPEEAAEDAETGETDEEEAEEE